MWKQWSKRINIWMAKCAWVHWTLPVMSKYREIMNAWRRPKYNEYRKWIVKIGRTRDVWTSFLKNVHLLWYPKSSRFGMKGHRSMCKKPPFLWKLQVKRGWNVAAKKWRLLSSSWWQSIVSHVDLWQAKTTYKWVFRPFSVSPHHFDDRSETLQKASVCDKNASEQKHSDFLNKRILFL